MRKNVALLDAPTNLGLRPPEAGAVPGCYKLPWALRDQGLLDALTAQDAGAVVPPRYRAEWQPSDGDRNGSAIASYAVMLADRVSGLLDHQRFPVVLGGDCSVLIGNMLALKRRGRFGLAFFDAHSDFRHPGNAEAIGAAAGEDLAIVTGRGDERLIDLQNTGPYVRDQDIHLVGVRAKDEHLDEVRAKGMRVTSSDRLELASPETVASEALRTVTRSTDGFWIHLDMDVVDAGEMPAVDCPEPNGPSLQTISDILRHLVASPDCVGMEVTIFDPDLDESGVLARRVVDALANAIADRSIRLR